MPSQPPPVLRLPPDTARSEPQEPLGAPLPASGSAPAPPRGLVLAAGEDCGRAGDTTWLDVPAPWVLLRSPTLHTVGMPGRGSHRDHKGGVPRDGAAASGRGLCAPGFVLEAKAVRGVTVLRALLCRLLQHGLRCGVSEGTETEPDARPVGVPRSGLWRRVVMCRASERSISKGIESKDGSSVRGPQFLAGVVGPLDALRGGVHGWPPGLAATSG